jgi:hypothetical protein
MSNTSLIYLDNPTDSSRENLQNFFNDAGITVEWADSPGNAKVTVDWPEEKAVCEPMILHAGGRISCPNAFAAAKRLNIDRGTMGNLLNHLNIRIFGCQLGCFP